MSKMVVFILSLLFLLGFNDAGQESIEPLNILDPSPMILRSLSHTDIPVAVSVSETHLYEVSSSLSMAESWVRTHVLTYFPSTKITHIVVGNDVLCNRDQEEMWGLVLPSLKNIYYSLVRWGLEREIKVSASFSGACLDPNSNLFRDELVTNLINPLLGFLLNSNSTYCVCPISDFSPLSSEAIDLVSAHYESIKKLGPFQMNGINVVLCTQEKQKPKSRKLSFMSFNFENSYSVPAHLVKNPLPPLTGIAPQPSMSFSFAPKGSPLGIPSNPPDSISLPPCSAVDMGAAPSPETGEVNPLWCVAKPSVPAATLEEAMDYACREGGADCEEIKPHGSCYNPDSVVAHASYAFNSYWQKNKRNGGTCSFGGTAMIINADPSFMHCRFILG
ncbi:glucan endo-1,3-beta-glucosidase 1-like [Macadamia integrifolia]|uniref:glucan endo-1,3-beta-glucosidase 1-like n=1 Tax=Macadamia integrifolia TaxID=60698 RepID=UPI001C4E340C|nr:glucan endo-1,3-beta-glucosidase 1-like [Macadamia integrifolia]